MLRLFLSGFQHCFVFGVGWPALGVVAADRLVLYTDITANINGYEIPSYSIDGHLVVVVSDLENYGFQTKYDNTTRTTTITRNDKVTAITPILSGKNYNHANVYDTDIQLVVCGKTVSGYNVGGKMTIPFSALAPFGTYRYDNDTRTSSLTVAGLPTAPQKERLTVTTTDKKLCINGVDLYGVVKLGDEYGIPVEVLTDENWICLRKTDHGFDRKYDVSIAHFEERDTMYCFSVDDGAHRTFAGACKPSYVNPKATVLGTAVTATKKLYASDRKTELGSIYLIDGRYPIIPMSVLGAVADGANFKLDTIPVEERLPIQYDTADLIGDILPTLRKTTEKETVLAIHDYLVNHLTYDPRISSWGSLSEERIAEIDAAEKAAEDKYILNANIVLTYRYGVCQDYSDLFCTMCNRVGIPCIRVSGSAKGGNHRWNMVYLEGKWQYIDCTWDDPVGTTPTLRYDYFLVDAEQLVKTHVWKGNDYPVPDDYDPNWENLDPMKLTSADQFRKCLAAQLKQGKTHFALRTTEYGGVNSYNRYNERNRYVYSIRMQYDSASYSYVFDVEYWDLTN